MDWLEGIGNLLRGGDRSTPEERFTRVDEDLISAADAIKEIRETRGFRMLLGLVDKRRQEIGRTALNDSVKPKEWWQGYDAGAGALQELIDTILEQAAVAMENEEAEAGAADSMKTGGGDLSV